MGIISHYFTKDNDLLTSNRKTIRFLVKGKAFEMETDKGVFSKAGLDYGTRVLLETLEIKSGSDVLDMGCGYGPIGIVLALLDNANVLMSDINDRAVRLSRENAQKNSVKLAVVQSDGFANVSGNFDVIVMNPPIRTGKKIIYALFESARAFLKEDGQLVIVINKKQGAESALSFLRTLYSTVDVLTKKSGYYVISSQK